MTVRFQKIVFVCISILFLQLPIHHLSAQNSYEFVNQNLSDIVYILSVQNGQSIICDETVTGVGNFQYFKGDSFNKSNSQDEFAEVFNAFLSSNRLYVNKTDTLWTVSKIKIENIDVNLWNVDCFDVTPLTLFNKLNEVTGIPISFDVLPAQKVSIHLKNLTVAEVVEAVLFSYTDYSVSENRDLRNTISVKRISEAANSRVSSFKQSDFNSVMNLRYAGKTDTNEALFDFDIRKTPIENAIDALFQENSRYSDYQPGYSLFTDGSTEILRASAKGKTFNEILKILTEQVNAQCYLDNDIWYIIPSSKNAIQDMISGRGLSNTVIKLKYRTAEEVISIIRNQYADEKELRLIPLGIYDISISGSNMRIEELKALIENIDIQNATDVISLKYITSDKLLDSLPPSIDPTDILTTAKADTVFFTGTPERKLQFLKELEILDQPEILIRYDLLIIQYQKSDSLNWGITGTVKPLQDSSSTVVTGELGNLLNVSFDAISVFGELFSLKLNTAMNSSYASVFADTTLYGLSGEKISFENTNTYRYRDTTTNNASGTSVYSSVTREITSGLELDISGWVSGDGMVTITVSASVSKQGVDVSRSTGNPPPTSEKSVTTKVRARSGEPVVLSGLTQTEESTVDNGIPILKSIPFLGNLFKHKEITTEQTEMVIYLVPHVEQSTSNTSIDYKNRAVTVLRETFGEN